MYFKRGETIRIKQELLVNDVESNYYAMHRITVISFLDDADCQVFYFVQHW
jgi:hypothetical protein